MPCFAKDILTVLLSALASVALVVLVLGVAAALGITLLTVGILRLARPRGAPRPVWGPRAWIAMGLILVGAVLLVPPWWAVASMILQR